MGMRLSTTSGRSDGRDSFCALLRGVSSTKDDTLLCGLHLYIVAYLVDSRSPEFPFRYKPFKLDFQYLTYIMIAIRSLSHRAMRAMVPSSLNFLKMG